VALIVASTKLWTWIGQQQDTCERVDTLNVLCTLDNNDSYGISDGKFVLNTSSSGDVANKQDAARALRNGDLKKANDNWALALQQTSNDAETLIYQENQRVLDEHKIWNTPYITVVVGTTLQENDGLSPGILQGAYLFQKNQNETPLAIPTQTRLPDVLIRIIIAKSGGDDAKSARVAQLVADAMKTDKTIVGVVGWPTTTTTKCTMGIFEAQQIPMISTTSTGDEQTLYNDDQPCKRLTSNYLFRIPPTDSRQMQVLVPYLYKHSLLGNAVILTKQDDVYARSVSDAFKTAFNEQNSLRNDKKTIIEEFSYEDLANLKSVLENLAAKGLAPQILLIATPDLQDLITSFDNIPASWSNLTIVTGSAGYELTSSSNKVKNHARLIFSTSAFQDMWKPNMTFTSFFTEYAQTFGPFGSPTENPYGWTRSNTYPMLAYDGMLTFATAYLHARKKQGNDELVTPQELQQGLQQITFSDPVWGITGRIAFDQHGDPIDKLVVILKVYEKGHNMEACDGYLTKTGC
jgi:ABC-type branched-subunit amino acid transport system substrate-binding protein